MIGVLTSSLFGRHTHVTTPHCVVGICSPVSRSAQPRSSGFFVRTIQRSPCCGGLDGETFGSAGSSCRSANPIQPATLGFAAFGGGFQPTHEGHAIMNTPAVTPSAVGYSQLFAINPAADHIDAIDAAQTRICQATSYIDVLLLAVGCEHSRPSSDTISGALWGLRELLVQASSAIDHAGEVAQ